MAPVTTLRTTAISCGLAAMWLSSGATRAEDPGDASAESSVAATAKAVDERPEGPTVAADQRYCDREGRAGLCDVYSPSAPPATTRGYPVIMVVHGGAWISGDKWTVERYSRLLAKDGFVAVAVNYRHAPEHKFPAQVDDIRQALLWLSENDERFSLDLDRIGLFGYSAGGHLSALIASLTDEPIPTQVLASSWPPSDARWGQLPKIAAVCVGGPPCDFRSLPIDNTSLAYFLGGSRREQPEAYRVASPSAHVSADDPVTQIIHGDSDLLVPIAGSRLFHQAQLEAGVDSRLHVMPDQGHMLTFLNPKTSTKVVEFFRETLSQDAASSP